jgi:PKD repeat protein
MTCRPARRLLALTLGALLTFTVFGAAPAPALISTTEPQLSINHLISTSPFAGSSTSVRDNEGSAYVAADDGLWLADDNANAIWELDRSTGALRRKIPHTTFINAPQFGGGPLAGEARSQDLEAIAYDAAADALFAFSGSTKAVPTVFRLTRATDGLLQVDSWQPLPSEWTGAGWRAADGLTYVANDATFRTYDYVTNTLGPAFSIPGLSKVFGVDFDDVTGDLLAVNNKEQLYRASMATRTLLTGWTGIPLAGLGFLDTRGVEVIGEQLYVSDGFDGRGDTDPWNHTVVVLDVAGPAGPAPTASFDASPTSGVAPLTVAFTDTSAGAPTSWAWDFGDGGTSTAQSPSHTYTDPGSYTATLTATNAQGTDTTTRTITVDPAPTEFTVTLEADTHVYSTSPNKNYGSHAFMKLHGDNAEYRPLLRFTLNGLSGPPSSVKLRMFVVDGSVNGGAWYPVANNWTESTVNWNTAPTVSGSPVATLGAVGVGSWIEVDLTSAITGNGTYSFMATSPSANSAEYSSNQGANPPQVIVVA